MKEKKMVNIKVDCDILELIDAQSTKEHRTRTSFIIVSCMDRIKREQLKDVKVL